MKSSVVVFPGSNCDRDVAVSLERVTGHKPTMVWHGDAHVPECDLIVLPGGFSYGDYLRSGAMAAHSPIMADVVAKARDGVAVLGICNGFQVLTESGLLPGVLMRNASLKFICRDIWLRVERADTIFTRGYGEGDVIRIPVAHHDGNYFADDDTHARLEDEGRIVLRYCDASGGLEGNANPNGSRANIAGLLSENGRVMGLMPHPERLADLALGGCDGAPIFRSLLDSIH